MKKFISLFLFLTVLSSGFAQKYMASFMLNPDYNGESVASMATVCMMSTRSESQKIEGLITRSSSAYRFKTLPTSSVFHGSTKLEVQQITEYLHTIQAEAILLVRLLPYNKKKEKISLPFYVNDDAKDPRHKSQQARGAESDNFYGDLYPSYQVTGKKETWQEAEQVRVQFTLIRIDGEQHLWSAFSKFIKTKKLEDSMEVMVEEMLAELAKQDLVQSR